MQIHGGLLSVFLHFKKARCLYLGGWVRLRKPGQNKKWLFRRSERFRRANAKTKTWTRGHSSPRSDRRYRRHNQLRQRRTNRGVPVQFVELIEVGPVIVLGAGRRAFIGLQIQQHTVALRMQFAEFSCRLVMRLIVSGFVFSNKTPQGQGRRQQGGQWCPLPPPISRLAPCLLHISNTEFLKCFPPAAISWRRACTRVTRRIWSQTVLPGNRDCASVTHLQSNILQAKAYKWNYEKGQK